MRVNDNVLFSRKNYQRGERTTDIEFLILNDNNSRFLEIIGKRYEKKSFGNYNIENLILYFFFFSFIISQGRVKKMTEQWRKKQMA